MRKVGVLLMLYAMSCVALAVEEIYSFDSAIDKARFEQLTHTIRCAVCQSQALAESDVLIARDMKQTIRDLIQKQQSDDAIKTFLSNRYGKDILLTPPFDISTWLLWLLPLTVILSLFGIAAYKLREWMSVS